MRRHADEIKGALVYLHCCTGSQGLGHAACELDWTRALSQLCLHSAVEASPSALCTSRMRRKQSKALSGLVCIEAGYTKVSDTGMR